MRTALSLLLLSASVSFAESPAFEKDILPIFQAQCLSCHGPDKQRGGLRLDRKADALAGGDSEKAIVPGHADKSLLLKRITASDSKERMPPKGDPLTADQITKLKTWIETGANWPDSTTAVEQPHWSFQPVRKSDVPKSGDSHPIDAFINSRLAKDGLKISPVADKTTLIRRLSFDLLGLPPTPGQINEFLKDQSPDSYAKLIDRLLASPAFGERQARHWLDVVRFAESNGFEMNQVRPNAYHYRDYVIKSFNDDKPYDRFVKEQIAGDVLGADVGTSFLVAGPWDQVKSPDPVLTAQQRADELHDMISTTGSAFLGLTIGCARCHNHKFDPISHTDYHAIKAVFAGVQHGERSVTPPAPKSPPGLVSPRTPSKPVKAGGNTEHFPTTLAKFIRFTILKSGGTQPCIDELEVFSADDSRKNVALAGNGAKATASSTLPGYAIHQLAHINDGKFGNDHSWISNEADRGWVMIEFAEASKVNQVVWSRDRTTPPKFQDRLATDYRVELSLDGKSWQTVASGANRPKTDGDGPKIYCGRMEGTPDVFRLNRGEVTQPKEKVGPGVLTSFGPKKAIPANATDAERRLALAEWIADPANPLTARVIVNRIWQHHFGAGLVDTPSDFGRNGAKPSHPELLDWLAAELVDHGWSLKHIHRLIVSSAVYQQQSKAIPAAMAKDAQTRLLWRFPPQRLEAEIIRDTILSVSGRLDGTMGGPGFDLFQPNGNYVKVYTPKNEFGPDTFRRMVYQSKPRMQLDDTFGAFDCPDAGQIAPKRSSSTTPLQALNLLNSPFLLQQSGFFADRLKKEAGEDAAKQVSRGFELAFGRKPTEDETAAAVKLVSTHGLPAFCRAIFNANEFVFVR
ncbi:DUF1553 domain-containing protein [Zavarzinella formosa]|uniref:DUF1553 domain-containing protein n=1 Tax=Zavarzinella formosa TaxID=360055 RepID=UPI000377D552|nr:DUF1553 domain-containing protein [Zavarzinella formosa]